MPNPFIKKDAQRYRDVMSKPAGTPLSKDDVYAIDAEIQRRRESAKARALYEQYTKELADKVSKGEWKRPGEFGVSGFGGGGEKKFSVGEYLGGLGGRFVTGVASLGNTFVAAEDIVKQVAKNSLQNSMGRAYDERVGKSVDDLVNKYGLFHNLYYGNKDLGLAGTKDVTQYYSDLVEQNANAINTGNKTADKVLRYSAKSAGDLVYGAGYASAMAAEALATGGTSAWQGVAQSTDDLVSLGSRVLERTGILDTLSMNGSRLLSDPSYWTSFAGEFGADYMEALERGASEQDALAYAVATSGLNSIIEVGGEIPGIQNPAEESLWRVAKSEGIEEIEQGPVERAMQNAMLGANNPWFSFTDENAVFNPVTAAKEGAMGAAIGGVLGAGQRGIVNAKENAMRNKAYQDLYGPDSAALVEEALEINPENKTAQKAQKKLEKGKALSGSSLRQIVEQNETKIDRTVSTEEDTTVLPATQDEVVEKFGRAGAEAYTAMRPSNVSETTYYHAFNTAYQYGQAGATVEQAQKSVRGAIPAEVVDAAFNAGKGAAEFELKRRQAQLRPTGTTGEKVGTLRLFDVDESAFNETQKNGMAVARMLTDFGFNVNVVRSRVDDKGRYIDQNGMYTPSTNTITISVDAGLKNIKSLATVAWGKTTSHELTHSFKVYAPVEYDALKSFVTTHLIGSGDISFDSLVKQKQDNAIAARLKPLTYQEAVDEVVADACENMLRDTKAINTLAEENFSLFKKIRDFLHDMTKKLKALFSGNIYSHEEAEAMVSVAEDLQKLWDDAFVTAVKNIQTMEYTGEDVDVKPSIRSGMETAGIEMRQNPETGKLSFYIDGKPVTHVTAEHIENSSAFGALIKIAHTGIGDTKGHITGMQAIQQFKAVADLMNTVMETQNPEMVWEIAGSSLFSAVKSNSDGQYGTTVDFTTVCRKTVEMITAMSEAMIAKGGGLTKAEVTQLQRKLIEAGSQVPCPVCYVFSRWAGVGSILDNMYKFQNKYADSTDAEIQARIAELKKRNTKEERKSIRKNLAENDEAYIQLAATRERMNAEKKAFRTQLKKAQKAGDTVLIESLQKSIENADFIAKNAAKQMDEMVKGLDTAAQELSWLERVRTKEGYKAVPKNILFNMASSKAVETFMKEYPRSWSYRTTRGPAAGKAILPYSDMKLGDLIMPLKSKSSDGNKTFADPMSIKGEFNDQQKKAIIAAIARVRAQNLIGGQRFQSTSDFRYDYALDYIQAFFEAQALGSNMQTYTKIVEFGEMVARIGGDVNLSVMPRNKGYENGHLIFSNVTGIDFNAARRLSEMYDSAQLILVGINDEHIRLALEDSEETGGIHIGFVIPYHTSGASIEEFIRALVSNLNEDFVRSNYQDYSDVQTDHAKKAKEVTEDQFRRRDLRKRILTGGDISGQDLDLMKRDAAGKTDITGRSFEELLEIENRALEGDQDAIREYESWSAGVLQALYEKMRTESGSEYGVQLNSKQAEAVMPHEYWDKNTTRDTAYLNGFIFRSYCYNMGLSPRFTGISSRGQVDHGNFRDSRGYWKTLIDRAMYANDGKYRDQQKINMSEIQAGMITPEYAETYWGEYKVAEPDSDRAARVGSEFGRTFVDASIGENVQYSTREGADPEPLRNPDGSIKYVYKAFYAMDGKLYPPMVANLSDAEKKRVSGAVSGTQKSLDTPVGIWLDADIGELALDENGEPLRNTRGRLAVVNAKGGGTLAFRPGWHLGEWPDAKQFNKNDKEHGARSVMPASMVFAKCEIAADHDYQLDAMELGMKANGKFDRTQAGLPYVPVDGYYKYRTNVDPTTAPWYITGAMRVVEILDDDDCAAICAEYGVEPSPREGGKINLADYGLKRGPVTPTANPEAYRKSDAAKRNEAALQAAMADERYTDAYTPRRINFEDAEILKEFERNGQDAEYYREQYGKTGKTQHSLREFEDGKRFVDVDVDESKFVGLSLAQQALVARRIIKDKFLGKVIGIDNKAYVNSEAAEEAVRFFRNEDPHNVEAKLRAATELDNLLDAGTNFRTEIDGKDGHVHPKATGDFRYFDTIFKVGNEYYSAVISIMPVKAGLLMHSITQIENITQDIAASYGKNPQSRFLRDASIDKVPQPWSNVKEKLAFLDAEYMELAKDPVKNAARLRKLVDEAAADAAMYRQNAGEEINIYIPDGVMKKDGTAVSFIDLILDGEKLGETRGLNTHFPVGRWIGVAKNGQVVGRVKFGPAKEITTSSPEYKAAKIAGTNYDIEPGQKKLYYPIVDKMDLRDSPRPVVRNGNYGSYQFKSGDLVTYEDNGDIVPLSKRFDVGNSEYRYSSREYTEQEERDHIRTAARHFGTTHNWNEAGYLTTDGQVLDFSGKHDGAPGGYRTVDHRDIKEALGLDYGGTGYSDAMIQFMSEGNIRLMPETGGINLQMEPTDEQYSGLRRYIAWALRHDGVALDFDNENGDTVRSEWYDPSPSISRNVAMAGEIINTIKAHYENEGRQVSDLARFHGQYSLREEDAISDRDLLANALETVAQNPAELEILKRYQAKTGELAEIQKKLAEQRALMRDHISGAKRLSTEEMLKARNRAELYAKQLDRADRDLLKLESMGPVKAMLDREHKAYRKALKAGERSKEQLARYNEKLQKQIEESRTRMANYRQRRRETEARRTYKARINRIANDFRQMLLHPTDSRYSPTELLSSAYEIALMLDTSGEREDTKSKAKFREQMRRLDDQYRALKENRDSDYSTEYDENFAYMVSQLRKRLDGKAIRDLSVTELEDVANVLHDIDQMLKQAKYQLGKAEKVTNYAVGESIIRQQRSYAAEQRNAAQRAAAAIERQSANALRNVRRMTQYDDTAALAELVQGLNEGIRKKNRFTMESNKLFDQMSGKRMRQAATEVKTYSVGGEEVQMTEMQAMQLVLSWEREATNGVTKHLTSGGILIPNAKLMEKGQGKEAIRTGRIVNGITQEDIENIYGSMDEWAREYMDAARYFFNVTAQNAINEATMLTKHRRIATTPNYIPFEIDPNTVAQEIEGVKFDATIEGMGMLKSVQEGAANALIMRGLDTIIQRHIEKAGQVYGLSVPIRNYNKAMGIHLIGDARTAKSSLYADDAKLLDQVVTDLQTPRVRDRNAVGKVLDKLQETFVKATLLSNVSVTIKQAASYSTAGLYLSQKALAPYQGTIAKLFANNDSKFAQDLFAEIDAHTATHYMRRQGMSLQEAAMIAQDKGKLTRLMDEKIKNDALNPLKWIQNMDVATTAALWLACKKQVELDGVKESDTGYWTRVTELYEKVIEDTQPMYDVLHRPEMLRTTDSLVRQVFMFKTQPLQNAGVIWDAVGAYNEAKRTGENLPQAKKQLARAVGSQLASLAVFATMSFIAYAVKNKLGRYKDEEEELTVESVMKRILLDMSSSAAGLVMPIGGTEAYSAVEGIVNKIANGGTQYDTLSVPAIDMVNDWITDITNLFNDLSDLDEKAGNVPKHLRVVAMDVAALFGIPAENVYNIIRGAVGNAGDLTGHPVDWATDESNTLKGMKAAWNNNHYDTAKKKMNDLIQEKMAEGKTEKEAKSSIKSSMTSYFKPMYLAAVQKKDTKEMDRIRKILIECGLYDNVTKTLADWTKG